MRLVAKVSFALLVVCAIAMPAMADDVLINITASAPYEQYTEDHNDGEPWGGAVTVNIENTGTEPWGDFHFEIKEVPNLSTDISNVDFNTSAGFEPTSTQTDLTWVVDNVSVGATIDLFFYSDPVLPGETATFTVYTDNQDQEPWFGVCVYPTPVPEPASLILLALGFFVMRRR